MEPFHHVFTRGFQHRKTALWICPNTTAVSFLGNKAAKQRWFSEDEHAEVFKRELTEAFRDDPNQADSWGER